MMRYTVEYIIYVKLYSFFIYKLLYRVIFFVKNDEKIVYFYLKFSITRTRYTLLISLKFIHRLQVNNVRNFWCLFQISNFNSLKMEIWKMSKISSVWIWFLIPTSGRTFQNFDKSQLRNVCISLYFFPSFQLSRNKL